MIVALPRSNTASAIIGASAPGACDRLVTRVRAGSLCEKPREAGASQSCSRVEPMSGVLQVWRWCGERVQRLDHPRPGGSRVYTDSNGGQRAAPIDVDASQTIRIYGLPYRSRDRDIAPYGSRRRRFCWTVEAHRQSCCGRNPVERKRAGGFCAQPPVAGAAAGGPTVVSGSAPWFMVVEGLDRREKILFSPSGSLRRAFVVEEPAPDRPTLDKSTLARMSANESFESER